MSARKDARPVKLPVEQPASAFVAFVASPAAAAVMKARGFE